MYPIADVIAAQVWQSAGIALAVGIGIGWLMAVLRFGSSDEHDRD